MTVPAIDLRSDTVTRPDAEMRRAMAEAEVGDDVFGEDPTVARLEAEGAAAVGQEAALFCPSGTMANQIALHLHGRPGAEVLCEARGHVLLYEMGAMAALSGLLPKPVAGDAAGRLDPAAVEAAVAPEVSYRSRTAVLVLENTHNMAGGTVTDRERLDALQAVARRHGLPVHLDGARLFNAAAALGAEPAQLAAGFDTVMLSLSKGLGAPVGSLFCGTRERVHEARRVRKMFGGGMRQVGVLAAAALVGLRRGVEPLKTDHANAKRLAAGLAEIEGLTPLAPETNIVMCDVAPAYFEGYEPEEGTAMAFLGMAREAGVLAVPVNRERVRLVTHRDVSEEQIDEALKRLRRAGGG